MYSGFIPFSLSPSSASSSSVLSWQHIYMGFPGGSAGKKSTCNVGDLGLIPGLGRCPGEGKGYPFQYSGLENPMDCIVLGVTKSQTHLSSFRFLFSTVLFVFYLFCLFLCPSPFALMKYLKVSLLYCFFKYLIVCFSSMISIWFCFSISKSPPKFATSLFMICTVPYRLSILFIVLF